MAYLEYLSVAAATERQIQIVTPVDGPDGEVARNLKLPRRVLKDELRIGKRKWVYVPSWLIRNMEKTFQNRDEVLRVRTTSEARAKGKKLTEPPEGTVMHELGSRPVPVAVPRAAWVPRRPRADENGVMFCTDIRVEPIALGKGQFLTLRAGWAFTVPLDPDHQKEMRRFVLGQLDDYEFEDETETIWAVRKEQRGREEIMVFTSKSSDEAMQIPAVRLRRALQV